MAPPLPRDINHNDKLRRYVLDRDHERCQWPGCGDFGSVDVMFILESLEKKAEGGEFYQNGITLCRKHMDLVNLHQKTFGPFVYDLIRMVEFELDLTATEREVKAILRR